MNFFKLTSFLFLIPFFFATFSSSAVAAAAVYGNHLQQHEGENGAPSTKNAQNEQQNIRFQNQNLDKVEANSKILNTLKKSGGGGGHGRGGGFGGGTAGAANHHATTRNKNGGSIRQRPFSLVVILSLTYYALSLL